MENIRRLQAPYGTRVRRIYTFLISACHRHTMSSTRIYVKLDHISSLMPQIASLGKICEPRYFGPKLAKSAIFSIFFSFSNITVEIFILEENFCLHKCRAHQAASFPFFAIARLKVIGATFRKTE